LLYSMFLKAKTTKIKLRAEALRNKAANPKEEMINPERAWVADMPTWVPIIKMPISPANEP